MVDPSWLARVRLKNQEALGMSGMGGSSASAGAAVLARVRGSVRPAVAVAALRDPRQTPGGVPFLPAPAPSKLPGRLFATAGVIAVLGIGYMLVRGGRR